jgi:hypothetical protein
VHQRILHDSLLKAMEYHKFSKIRDEKKRAVTVQMLQCLITEVTKFRRQLFVHPMIPALELLSNSDLLVHLVSSEDSPLYEGAPTSFTKSVGCEDRENLATLRNECGVPEEAEFDLPGVFLHNTLPYKNGWFMPEIPHKNIFECLDKYCKKKGQNASTIHPIVALIYNIIKHPVLYSFEFWAVECMPLRPAVGKYLLGKT